MKIEKVNDNQIRCTLTKEDLEERQLKISEIAYGSDKAKLLFKDLMQQANFQYGFEADNMPLMIEAIPLSTGCIVFIITKVDDPEELDTRFSRFAPSIHEDDEENDSYDDLNKSDVLDGLPVNEKDVSELFKEISDIAKKNVDKTGNAEKTNTSEPNQEAEKIISSIRIFSFENMDELISACKLLSAIYHGESALYKNPENGRYFLSLTRGLSDKRDFVKICNLLIEYACPEQTNSASIAYIEEHYEVLLEENAVAGIGLL